MFGQEVREDRAGWMDGPAANLGNRCCANPWHTPFLLCCALMYAELEYCSKRYLRTCNYLQACTSRNSMVKWSFCVSGKKLPMTCVLV